MPDARRREWRFHLDDMIEFARKVLAYTDGLDQAGFVARWSPLLAWQVGGFAMVRAERGCIGPMSV